MTRTYTPPQSVGDQVAALAPYYPAAVNRILGIEADHHEAQNLVALAAERLVDGHSVYGASGLFSIPTAKLEYEMQCEIADALNYDAESHRRRALDIEIPAPRVSTGDAVRILWGRHTGTRGKVVSITNPGPPSVGVMIVMLEDGVKATWPIAGEGVAWERA